MTFHEFPKALYRKGEYIAVNDGPAETEARKQGFTDWHSDQKAMNDPEPERPKLTLAKR